MQVFCGEMMWRFIYYLTSYQLIPPLTWYDRRYKPWSPTWRLEPTSPHSEERKKVSSWTQWSPFLWLDVLFLLKIQIHHINRIYPSLCKVKKQVCLGVWTVKSRKCTKSRTLTISLLINGRKEESETTCKSSRGFQFTLLTWFKYIFTQSQCFVQVYILPQSQFVGKLF